MVEIKVKRKQVIFDPLMEPNYHVYLNIFEEKDEDLTYVCRDCHPT